MLKTNNTYTRVGIIFNSLLVFFIVISVAGLSGIYDYGEYVTYILMPLAILSSVISNRFAFYSFKSHLFFFYLIFIVIAIMTTFLAVNIETAIANIKTMVMVMMVIVFTTEYCKNKNYDFKLIFLYSIILGALFADLILLFGNLRIDALYSVDREFELNANTYSYTNYFALASLLLLGKLRPLKYHKVAVLVFFVLSVYLAFVTASRQAIIFLLMLLASALITQSILSLKMIIKLVILAIPIGYVIFIGANHAIDTFLYKRMEYASQSYMDEIRFRLIMDSVDVFLSNFWTGVGPAQYLEYSSVGKALFSHNSFTEAAANFGIFGLLAILMFFLSPLYVLVLSYRRNQVSQNAFSLIFSILLITFLYQNFYVFYLYPVFIVFYVVMYEMIVTKPKPNRIE